MLKLYQNTITAFHTGHEDFILEIMETVDNDNEPMFESWIYRENTGCKMFVVCEYKKHYPGLSVSDYARTCIKYIKTVGTNGLNHYDIYDQDIEDMELAAWNRDKQHRSAPDLTART